MSSRRAPATRTTLAFVLVAGLCLLAADLQIITLSPWDELGRMLWGVVSPNFREPLRLADALLQTLTFAFAGISLAVMMGFPLALCFRWAPVRIYCAFVRAIHELFWGLLFLQAVGLNPWCGVLAIAIPFSGVLAKVYAEILEEADLRPLQSLPHGAGHVEAFFFVRLPDVWHHLKHYSGYRLECALRSSTILGFIGFPTLGFHLHTAFLEGHYADVSALLILFYLLIASLRFWVRPRLVPIYALAAWVMLPAGTAFSLHNVTRFLTRDIIPAPVRGSLHDGPEALAEHLPQLAEWGQRMVMDQALPGAITTLLLSQITLITTGALALVLFPWISRIFVRGYLLELSRLAVIVMRSTPEYVLAFTFLLLWGPSWLPAIAALTIHNGAIIAHLIARHADTMALRPDAPRGLNRYAFEVVPRLYGQFLAFLFYRWEMILRETAILGILGIHTLGFHIDSALAGDRQDRVMLLILLTALLNIAVDAFSRRLRARLRLRTTAKAV